VGAPDGFFISFRSRGEGDVLVNNCDFVYRANPGKESAIRRRSRSARPHTDVMKRHAAMRSDAVVADKRVDSPPV
jgi:hypothetical protein